MPTITHLNNFGTLALRIFFAMDFIDPPSLRIVLCNVMFYILLVEGREALCLYSDKNAPAHGVVISAGALCAPSQCACAYNADAKTWQ